MGQTRLATDVERLTDSLGQLPEPAANPAFVVVSGLPGTGKSYFCGTLAERLPFVVLESDALRKVLFSPPSYSAGESFSLFRMVHRLIGSLLEKGVPVIFDATNLSESNREYLYSIAEHLDVRLVMVWVHAPPEVVHERLKKRPKDSGSKSDADWAVYQKLKRSVEKIRRKHYVVDTSRDIGPALDKIIREIMR